jgi:hypothetical protein
VSRSKRVEALEAQYHPPADDRFQPWGPEGTREAWATVGTEERERLWSLFLRCGRYGTSAPCLVTRGPDGQWRVSTFNTPFGAMCSGIQTAWEALGTEDMFAWFERECTPDELEMLCRLLDARWSPSALREGDLDVLSGLCHRLPQTHP